MCNLLWLGVLPSKILGKTPVYMSKNPAQSKHSLSAIVYNHLMDHIN